MTRLGNNDIIAIEREVRKMIISYELVDDALCDLDDTLDCYEDCTQCPLFYDCMNVIESEDDEDD